MSGQIQVTELSALIHLLDDPDREVYQHVSEKLKELGLDVIPKLEHAWEDSFDPIMQERIEQIIHQIQFENLRDGLKGWVETEEQDLLDAMLLFTRYQYPEFDEELIRNEVEELRKAVWLELNFNLTPLEQVNVFNHVFYSISGFTGDSTDPNNIPSYFINNAFSLKERELLFARADLFDHSTEVGFADLWCGLT